MWLFRDGDKGRVLGHECVCERLRASAGVYLGFRVRWVRGASARLSMEIIPLLLRSREGGGGVAGASLLFQGCGVEGCKIFRLSPEITEG